MILAPVDGVITDVTSTPTGDKIQANTPLGGIAPKKARPLLQIEIAEHDRAFLREGLPVKLKFNAFPYQRYGLLNGTQTGRTISFFTVVFGKVTRVVEFWPEPYAAPANRWHLAEAIV